MRAQLAAYQANRLSTFAFRKAALCRQLLVVSNGECISTRRPFGMEVSLCTIAEALMVPLLLCGAQGCAHFNCHIPARRYLQNACLIYRYKPSYTLMQASCEEVVTNFGDLYWNKSMALIIQELKPDLIIEDI